MLSLGIDSNLDKVAQALEAAATKQVPYAISLALNRVAEFSKSALRSNMQVVFDRPKPFTLNSLFIKKSNKTNLTATIFHSDRVIPYLLPEIAGGTRGEKPFEIKLGNDVLVPTNNLRRDSYGGISKGMIAKILKAAKPISRAPDEYVIVKPGSKVSLSPGIYQRKDGKIRALFLFKSTAKYEPRYDMLGVVERTVQAEFGRQFAAMMDYALSTARVNIPE